MVRVTPECLILVAVGLLIGWAVRIPGVDNLPESPRSQRFASSGGNVQASRPVTQPSLAKERATYLEEKEQERRERREQEKLQEAAKLRGVVLKEEQEREERARDVQKAREYETKAERLRSEKLEAKRWGDIDAAVAGANVGKSDTKAVLPGYLYGTAWKGEKTAWLVTQAVEAGFRGVDTANQPRHYQEKEVGRALVELFNKGAVKRENLFIQTKFTHTNGQDPDNMPYDKSAGITEQVRQSFHSTLLHLPVQYVDSYVLHGPSVGGSSLGPKDWEAWRAMENIQRSGGARVLGISNVNIDQLTELVSKAVVKPKFVQNRCYANTGWDMTVRQYCKSQEITYQGFSVLTANWQVVRHPKVQEIADRLSATPEQVVFKFAMQIGMLPLTGTNTRKHMNQDLDILNWSKELKLTEDELSFIEIGFMT